MTKRNSRRVRLLRRLPAVLTVLLAASTVSADAVGSPVGKPGGSTRSFKVLYGAGRGVVYRRDSAGLRAARRQAAVSCSVSCAGPLEYHGGPVMHAHKTYTIYWAPPIASANGQPNTSFTPFPAGYEGTINSFLANVAADSGKLSNVYSTDIQYGEPSGGIYSSEFGGTFVDTDLYPSRNTTSTTEDCPISAGGDGLPPSNQPCLTDAQIETELTAFHAAHPLLPTALEAMYFIVTPQGVNSCAGGAGAAAQCSTNVYCAYHFETSTPLLIYANMPYDHVRGCETPDEPNKTPADDEINTLSHEHNEAVTDPDGTGWYKGEFVEDGDKCTYPFFNPGEDGNTSADAYGSLLGGTPQSSPPTPGTAYNQIINSGHYLLQREWSNAAGGCVTQAPVPVASFAVYSTPAIVGHAVSFNGSSSSPSAGAITGYRWDFGDGSPTETGAEVTHTYHSTGQFTVRLTVTNDSRASATASQAVTINEPSSTEGQTTTVTTTVTTPAPLPPPVTVTATTRAPRAFSASQLTGLIGLPANGAKLSGLGAISLGRAECRPACGVTLKLYATVRTTKRHRTTVKQVLIGLLRTTIAARGTGALALTLNARGRMLLRKSHPLACKLVVTVEGQEGGTWQIVRSLTLTR
jgi:PKD repeat protein